jgi:hypothetical protein
MTPVPGAAMHGFVLRLQFHQTAIAARSAQADIAARYCCGRRQDATFKFRYRYAWGQSPGRSARTAICVPNIRRKGQRAAMDARHPHAPAKPVPAHRRVGLALGSGSARGLAHIGVLRAL